MSVRIESHIIEEKAESNFRNMILNDNIIYRNITGRDYGIDGIVEVFKNNNPTGKIAFLQIKGTSKKIIPLKRKPLIACSGVSKSNLLYCKQKNIPVILIYLQYNGNVFYYNILNDENISKIKDKNTVHINMDNFIQKDINVADFAKLIEDFYEK